MVLLADRPKKDLTAAQQKRLVYNGSMTQTVSGLKKSDLTLSKAGKVVSKLKQAQGHKQMARLKREGKWTPAEPFEKQ
jgi:arginyl-tRNA synthetase